MTTCQHCGVPIGPRSKNCGECNAIKNEANKNGTYRTVVNTLETAKRNGLTGAAVRQVARQAMQAELERQNTESRRERDEQKAHEQLRRERQATNDLLRKHGYTWRREDEESMDAFGATAFGDLYGNRDYVWILSAPDGRQVTVEQALKEIGK